MMHTHMLLSKLWDNYSFFLILQLSQMFANEHSGCENESLPPIVYLSGDCSLFYVAAAEVPRLATALKCDSTKVPKLCNIHHKVLKPIKSEGNASCPVSELAS